MAKKESGGTQIAKAYVQIVPVAKGFENSLREALGEEMDKSGSEAGVSAGSAFGKAFKTALAAIGAGKILKESLLAGADLQQSLGGVETLFKDSSVRVIDNARRAYETAGMDANAYMQTVTGFSASLLQSLGDDTAKAAEIADMAIIDMSDNANKMGTSMESIQNAYQGFAKQNYTMLDNLKLGYGGTKEEMERLLADAEKLSGIHYDISSLSDVYEAIHVIQTDLDITGTTAKEAATTFTGSFNAMKAAAGNFMADLSSGTGDLNEDIKALTSSSDTFIRGNLLPFLGNVVKGLESIEGPLGSLITAAKGAAMYIAITKLSNVLMTVAIPAINASTVSIQALNTAFMANPIGWTVAAITAEAAIFDYFTSKIDVTTSNYNSLTDAQKAYVDQNSELMTSLNDSAAKREVERTAVNEQAETYEYLKNRLYELDSAQELDTASKAEMAEIAKTLNSEITGLNIVLDEETGHLRTSRAEIDKRISSIQRETKAEAARAQLVEIYRDISKAQKAASEAEDQYIKAKEEENRIIHSFDSTSAQISAAKDRTAELAVVYTTAAQKLRDLSSEADNTAKAVAENSDEMVSAAEDSVGHMDTVAMQYGDKLYKVSLDTVSRLSEIDQAYKAAVDERRDELWESLDLFNEFAGGAEVSAQELMDNLLENNIGIGQWADELAELADRGVNEGLIKTLQEAGPSSASKVHALTQMTDTELQEYSRLWQDTYWKVENIAKEQTSVLPYEAQKTVVLMAENMRNNIDRVYISSHTVGEMMALGVKEGFESQIQYVSDSVAGGILAITRSMADAADIHSPSRLTRDLIGKNLARGIPVGYDDEMGDIRKQVAESTCSIIPEVDSISHRQSGSSGTGSPVVLRLTDQGGRIIAEGVYPYIDEMQGMDVQLSGKGLAV